MRLPMIALLATATLLTGCITPSRERERRRHVAAELTAPPAPAAPAARAA